jgi:ABC-2 type transport system permease protein
MKNGRLSILFAAFVVARRDFTAILFGRSFIFFLLAPFFPVVIAVIAGGIGQNVRQAATQPELGIAMSAADAAAMVAARNRLAEQIDPGIPPIRVLGQGNPGTELPFSAELGPANVAAVVSGTPAAPVLSGPPDRLETWQGTVALIAGTAARNAPTTYPEVALNRTQTSNAEGPQNRAGTAQGAQTLLFLLTMILAGMVLSNLVEEKGNKIIEVLAAAIPMEAVFLGKLFAMLAVSFVAIAVWAGVASVALAGGQLLPQIAPPAVGWTAFVLLGVAYFAMAYLLLGSVFLAIGSLAATVRDVQTLSFPVTMLQLIVFLFATFAATQAGSPLELAAVIVPFSSPFTMLARAANEAALWPHLGALAWQVLWVAISVRLGARLFRTRVMKSGRGRPMLGWLRRRAPASRT